MKNIDDIRGKKINEKMIYVYIFQGKRYYLTIKLYCTFNTDVSFFRIHSPREVPKERFRDTALRPRRHVQISFTCIRDARARACGTVVS